MHYSGKKFVVIGGAGFIGSHVVDQLTSTDAAEIVIYDNFFRGRRENLAHALKDPRVTIFPHGGDVLHEDILDRCLEGADGVFHLAALWLLQCHEYPRAAFDVNVRGTFNVMMAAIRQKVRRVVFSSSASVYGDAVEDLMTESHPYNNLTFYGATKISGEHLFKSLGDRYGLDWVGLRYMNVYGPRQDYEGAYVSVIMKMLDRIDAGQPPIVYGDGSQMYDFVYVEDCAAANLAAMQADTSDEFYNVGTGVGTRIRELAEVILDVTGADLDIQYEPAGLTFVTHRVGCPHKAHRELGFEAGTDFRTGIDRLIHWRRRQKKEIVR